MSDDYRHPDALVSTEWLAEHLDAPDLVVLDEPFSGLDTMTRRSIHTQFLEVRSRVPISTILVTHDPEEAVRLAERAVSLTQSRDADALDALAAAEEHFRSGCRALSNSAAGEILAEELRLSQHALGEITGVDFS